MKRILITGGTGFIGGRIVERLYLDGIAEATCLVHRFSRASGIARFPVKLVAGEVWDRQALKEAMTGCDAVIHCAMSFSGLRRADRHAIVEGARAVCDVATDVGIQRLVHFSTFSVYGYRHTGMLTEQSSHRPGGEAYGRLKDEAERMVLARARAGLPAVILQPMIVYGPNAHWTAGTVGKLLTGPVVLPVEGRGKCPAVFVDDVVDAVFLALSAPAAIGETFLINGPDSLTWEEFFQGHAREIPGAGVVAKSTAEVMSVAQAAQNEKTTLKLFTKELRENGEFRRILKSLPLIRSGEALVRNLISPEKWKSIQSKQFRPKTAPRSVQPSGPAEIFPSLAEIPVLSMEANVSIAKAREKLGFVPRTSWETGMKKTLEWLRWARMVPKSDQVSDSVP